MLYSANSLSLSRSSFLPILLLFFTTGCNGTGSRERNAPEVSVYDKATGQPSLNSSLDSTIPDAPSSDSVLVTLFMVESAEGAGAKGTFGCGDVLIGREYLIRKSENLLAGTIRALLAPENDGPANYAAGGTIRLDSATIRRGIGRVYLSGRFLLAGACDHPRIEEQLRRTAMQFPDVDSVIVYVGLQRLEDYLSLK